MMITRLRWRPDKKFTVQTLKLQQQGFNIINYVWDRLYGLDSKGSSCLIEKKKIQHFDVDNCVFNKTPVGRSDMRVFRYRRLRLFTTINSQITSFLLCANRAKLLAKYRNNSKQT